MDKNNDIKVNKVNKWKEAPDSIKDLYSAINAIFAGLSFIIDPRVADDKNYTLNNLLTRVLDDYNELEAKYQKNTGMISEYEEENRILREQRNRLIEAKNKFAEDNGYLRRERDRHIDLLDKLRWALEDKGIYCEWSEAALEWRLHGKNKLVDELREHYEEELRIREKEKDEKDKLIEELRQKIEAIELKNSKDIAYGYFNLIASLRERIKILEKENEELKTKNRSLQLRTNMMYACHRSTDNANRKMAKVVAEFDNKNKELNRKIETLEKENKDLKDTLAKDMEFGKNVGNLVADSIREGCDKGVYKLHPYTRIDIHIEETNNMPLIFDRHAIPRISVMFNNTQTEMERDTAQHECEELFDSIIFEGVEVIDGIERNPRQQAQAVINSMIDHIEMYGYATVRDLYDYANITTRDYTESAYGWRSFATARPEPVAGGGYIIVCPKPEYLGAK